MQKTLEELLLELGTKRAVVSRLKEKAEAVMQEALAQTEYYKIKDRYVMEAQALDELDQQVRDQAIVDNDHNIPLPLAVKVQNGQEAVIVNENKAREWCMSNFTPALLLDTKAFKSAIKSGSIPEELGYMIHIPKVKIATDLPSDKNMVEALSDVGN